MKLVDQSVKVWGECPTDITEAKLWIERAGRTCYNSPMPETPDPDKFLDRVMSHDPPHSSMFEHSNLVLGVPSHIAASQSFVDRFLMSRYIHVIRVSGEVKCIWGNYRAFMEVLDCASISDMIEGVTSLGFRIVDGASFTTRVTVELHTDRNILAEITRHRDDVAFSVRSQRYVDENGLMEFIKPSCGTITRISFSKRHSFIHASRLNLTTGLCEKPSLLSMPGSPSQVRSRL